MEWLTFLRAASRPHHRLTPSSPPRPSPVSPPHLPYPMPHSTNDQQILALSRAGVAPSVIYEALWPGSKPFPYTQLLSLIRTLEIADATAMPEETLPTDLEEVVGQLMESRVRIMEAIRSGGDLDAEGGFDATAHQALVKNAEAVLKFQSARQSRQEHLLNLRAAQERARIELGRLYEAGDDAGSN